MDIKDKLLTLLQPRNYESKIKLYCQDCEFKINKHNYERS